MLKHVGNARPIVSSYICAAYSKPSFLFYGDIFVQSEEKTKQEEPQLFAKTIQALVTQISSNFNTW